MPKTDGVKKKEIDFDELDELLRIQCTSVECAAVFHVSVDILNKRIKEKHGVTFTDYSDAKKAGGKTNIRRKQFQRAEAGSDTMLIWWGKQYLGQSDKLDSRIIEDVKILPAVLPDKAPEKKEE